MNLGQTTNNLYYTQLENGIFRILPHVPLIYSFLHHAAYYIWNKHLEFRNQTLDLFIFCIYHSFSIILGVMNIC